MLCLQARITWMQMELSKMHRIFWLQMKILIDPQSRLSVGNKRNQINSFLARVKDDINGIKDALLDQIAAPIIEEEFQDIIEMVKTYNKAIAPLLDLPEDPTRDAGVIDFISSHRDEHKSLNQEVKSLKLRVQRLFTMHAMRNYKHHTPSRCQIYQLSICHKAAQNSNPSF